jgi:ligand-binding sensor domain-containing protein
MAPPSRSHLASGGLCAITRLCTSLGISGPAVRRAVAASLVCVAAALQVAAATPEWVHYRPGGRIHALAAGDDYVWAGGTDGGLWRLDRPGGQVATPSSVPDPMARDIVTGADGRLYVGLSRGLHVCEASRCTTYTPENSPLPHAGVQALALAADGALWVATGAGVACLDGTTWRSPEDIGGPAAATEARLLAADARNGIWMGSRHALCRFADGEWDVFTPDNSGLPDHLIALTADAGGAVWVGTWGGGVASFDGSRWDQYTATNSDLPDDIVTALAAGADGAIWAGTWNRGLARFDGERWETFDTDNSGLPDDWIMSLAVDPNGELFAGTWYGISHYDGSDWSPYAAPNGQLGDLDVFDVQFDAAGHVWISTLRTVARFDGRHWFPASGNSCCIHSVTVDATGAAWFGGRQGPGLYRWDGQHLDLFHPTNSNLPSDHVLSVLADPRGWIWVATESGLAQVGDDGWIVHDPATTGLSYQIINSINDMALADDGTLWIAAHRGIAWYDGNEWNVLTDGLPGPGTVTDVIVHPEGGVWCSTYGRLMRFDGRTVTVHDSTNSPISDGSATSLALELDGRLWVGTTDGLLCFDGATWTVRDSLNSALPSNHIYTVAVDAHGNKWIGMDGKGGLAVYREGGVVLPGYQPTTVVGEAPVPTSSVCHLYPSYPNPFNTSTMIPIALSQPGHARLCAYTVTGQRVRTLVDAAMPAGVHTVHWDGTGPCAEPLASGVYILRLTTDDGRATRRVALVR